MPPSFNFPAANSLLNLIFFYSSPFFYSTDSDLQGSIQSGEEGIAHKPRANGKNVRTGA